MTAVASDVAADHAHRLLDLWFDGCDGIRAVSRFTSPHRGPSTTYYGPGEHAAMAEALAGWGHMFPTYTRISTLADRPTTGRRGGAGDTLELPGLYADVDCAWGVHSTELPLPATLEQALEPLSGLPAPTVVVDSGGGLYPLWKLTRPLTDLETAGDAQQRLAAELRRRYNAAGWHFDELRDVARLLRWPGTQNAKRANDPRDVGVRLELGSGSRCTLDEMLAELPELEPAPIVNGHDFDAPAPSSTDAHPMQALRGMGHDGHRWVAQMLASSGWTITADTGTYIDLVRPGGSSERSIRLGGQHPTTGDDMTGQVHPFSHAIPGVDGDQGYTLGGFLSAYYFDGDDRRCNDWLVDQGIGQPLTGKLDPTAYLEAAQPALPPPRPAGPVAVYWADEVAADPPPPIDELVTNLVATGEVTVFGAPRAMGKTWATMGLASAVATGSGYMFGSERFAVRRSGTVAYLQGELGRSASHVRWNLATGGRPPHVAEVFERLRVKTTARRVTHRNDVLSWTDEESVAVVDERLEPLLDELGCELLIVDPWATYFAGNENSNDEAEAAVDAITQMARRVGCAVWIVHHISAKATHGSLAEPEDLWRGASRLADAVATRVTMLPHYTPARARELGLDRFQARRYGDLHVLQRNGPPVPLVHTQLEQYRWQRWQPPDDGGGRPPALGDQDIVRALSAAGGTIESKRKLAEAVDTSVAALDRHLERLVATGVVVVENGARNASVYRLTGTGTPR